MTRLFVIADDLTGATDAGAQLSARGIQADVWICPNEFLDAPEQRWDATGLVVNSESRHLPANEASAIVARLVKAATGQSGAFIYKKTDSTLRGNVGAELTAALRMSGAEWLPFIPASPALGRTTRDGIQFVDGVPLAETVYARDPCNPIRSSSVREILAAQTDAPIHEAKGPLAVARRNGIIVFDASDLEDLRTIAASLRARTNIAAGPAAFLQSLSDSLSLPASGNSSAALERPLLLFNGSLNPLSREQLNHPSLKRYPRWNLSPSVLLGSGDTVAGSPLPTSTSPNDVLIVSTTDSTGSTDEYRAAARTFHIAEQQLPARIAESAGRIFARLQSRGWGSCVVIGGDTLSGIARACGWSQFESCGEAAPGVALVREKRSGLVIATKPGGFGDADTIANLLATSQRL